MEANEDQAVIDPPPNQEEQPREPEEADQNQNNEDDDEDDDFMPIDILSPGDPRRMRLTREERGWAHAVKAAVESSPDIDNLSDFLYAQIAIVDERNLAKAVDRARLLQAFRQEYQVKDTLEDAKWRMVRWIQRLPGHVMHHFYCEEKGGYVLVLDLARIDSSCLKSEEGLNDFLAGTYYVHHTLCPDMDAIRQGATFLAECTGYKWRAPNMADLSLVRLGVGDSLATYPMDCRGVQFFNTGVMVNTLVSMSRQFSPENMRQKFTVGHRSVVPLRDICMSPSVEAATKRVIKSMIDALQERYQHVESFKL